MFNLPGGGDLMGAIHLTEETQIVCVDGAIDLLYTHLMCSILSNTHV